MKLYELQKGDKFTAKFYDPTTERLAITISGEFIAIDGIYGVVELEGVEGQQNLNIDLEVEKDNA